jgi:hypothetical protein
LIDFSHSSTAGSATIFNNEGATQFFDSSTAGSATINSSGEIGFFGSSKGWHSAG